MTDMDIKSALAGAGVVVAAAVGGVLAISAVNAQEPPAAEAVEADDTYTGPYVYWQAPEPLPHITVPPKPVEPVVKEEAAMPEENDRPAADAVEEPAAPKPKSEPVEIVESNEGPGEPPIVVRSGDDPPPLDPGVEDSAPLPLP